MPRTAIIEIHKDELSFSSGHFTIFSATHREDMHGHNYNVNVAFEVTIGENGLAFDYRVYKDKLRKICKTLDWRFLLPAHSPYLTLEDTGEMWVGHFHHEKIPFLKRDVIILPISNVTIEELSYWFLQQLISDQNELEKHGIHGIAVRVFNGPGQSGEARWVIS